MNRLHFILAILSVVVFTSTMPSPPMDSANTQSDVWSEGMRKFAAFRASSKMPSEPSGTQSLPVATVESSEPVWPWQQLSMVLFVGLSVSLIHLRRVQRRPRVEDDLPANAEASEFCAQLLACESTDEQRAILTRLALRAQRHPIQTKPGLISSDVELSRTEWLLAALDYDEIPTEITADILGKTKGTVYNLRSALRKKMDRP